MIGLGGNPGPGQAMTHAFHGVSGRSVDDAGASCMKHRPDQGLETITRPWDAFDRPPQVPSIEGLDDDHRPLEPKRFAHVSSNRGGRTRGQGEHGHGNGSIRSEATEAPVGRSKVVTPLADAVRLVDRNQREVESLDQPPERRHREPLRRHEKEVETTVPESSKHRPALITGLDRRKALGPKPRRPSTTDLILHERDEWAHDDRDPVQYHGRDLIAHALSTTGGQNAQSIPSGQHGTDQLFLAGAERRKAEAGSKHRSRVHPEASAVSAGADMPR